jgi:glycerol uptake facilitator-like aquaporin
MSIPKGLSVLYMGLLVTSIGLAFGMNCGNAINPARDLGPRFFASMAGYGGEVF